MIKNKTYSSKSYDDFLEYERIKFKAESIFKLNFSSVLDVGCASGLSLHLLRNNKNKADFLGIDNDLEMIEHAKDFFSDDEHSEFQLSTIESLGNDTKFDLVLLWGLISFYDSYEDLIIKIKSHLSKTGSISIWSGFSNSEYDVFVSYSKDGANHPGLNMFSLPRLIGFLEENNLAVEVNQFIPTVPLQKDPLNPLVSYTLLDDNNCYAIVNGLNIVRDFYHLIVTNK